MLGKNKKFLSLFVVVVCGLYTHYVSAMSTMSTMGTPDTETCPEGYFCINNGQYTMPIKRSIREHTKLPSRLITTDYYEFPEMLCPDRHYDSRSCQYYLEDYDEVWYSETPKLGYYLVKNDKAKYYSVSDRTAPDIFSCPATYPLSDGGAKSVFECYTYTQSGQKEYYSASESMKFNGSGKYDDSLVGLVENLQSTLDKIHKAAQDLQASLKLDNVNKVAQDLQTVVNQAKSNTTNTNNTKETNTVSTNSDKTSNMNDSVLKIIDNKLGNSTTLKNTETEQKTDKKIKAIDFGKLSGASLFSDRAATHTNVRKIQNNNIANSRQVVTMNKSELQPKNSRSQSVRSGNVPLDSGQRNGSLNRDRGADVNKPSRTAGKTI